MESQGVGVAPWEELSGEDQIAWGESADAIAGRAISATRLHDLGDDEADADGCPIEAVLPDGHHPCTLQRDHKTGHEFAGEPRPSVTAPGAGTPAATAAAFVDRRCTYGSCVHKDGAYRMIGTCTNCRTEPVLGLFTADHEAQGGDCPVCGCSRLSWKRLATPDEIPAEFGADQ